MVSSENRTMILEILGKVTETEEEYGSFVCGKIISVYDGNEYDKEECVKLNGAGWVHKDQVEHYYLCSSCGKYHRLDNPNNPQLVTIAGDIICNTCFTSKSRYQRCEDCNAIIDLHKNGYYRGNDGRCYCSSCAEHYERCSECGRLIVDTDDAREYRGRTVCDDCYRELRGAVIQGYGHTRPDVFYKLDDEPETDEYFGIELEIGGGGYDNTDVAEYVYNEIDDLVECKSDSSIEDGFEIVTMPMTYKKHMSYKENWENFMDYAKSEGFESNASVNCGMHIHVSKKAFGSNRDKINDNIDKLLYIFEGFWENVVEFSRRDSSQIADWCSRYLDRDDSVTKDNIKYKKDGKDGNRYMAINLTNRETIEFRIFNGTLNVVTFCANLQFVKRLMDIITTMSEDEIMELTWHDIIYGDPKYEDLIKYYEKIKGVANNKKLRDMFEESEFMPDSFLIPEGTKFRVRRKISGGCSYGNVYYATPMEEYNGEWLSVPHDMAVRTRNIGTASFSTSGFSWSIRMMADVRFPAGTVLTPRKDIEEYEEFGGIEYLSSMNTDKVTVEEHREDGRIKMTNGFVYDPEMLVETHILKTYWDRF